MVLDGCFGFLWDVCDRADHGDEDDAMAVDWAVAVWLTSALAVALEALGLK